LELIASKLKHCITVVLKDPHKFKKKTSQSFCQSQYFMYYVHVERARK
jgi:hypothetical protein